MNVRDVAPLSTYQGRSSDALFLLNAQAEFTFLSEPFTVLSSYAAPELLGHSLARLFAPQDQEAVEQVLRHAREGEVLTMEVQVLSPMGQEQTLVLTTLPQLQEQALTGIVGLARPLDGEKPAAQQQAQLEVIFSTVLDIIFVLQVEPDEQYRFEFVNRAFENVTGLTAQQVVGHLVQDTIPEPSLSVVRAHYRQAMETKQRVTWVEVTDYPTGSLVGEVAVTPVYHEPDGSWRLIGTVHDLTAQKRVEEDLRLSNERFAYALKATSDALYDWNIETDTLIWGEGFEALFGTDIDNTPSTLGLWAKRVHPDDVALALAHLNRVVYETQQNTWQEEYRFRRANGTWAYVYERGLIIRDEAGRAVRMIGAMQDVTERKDAEEKQQQMTQELFRQNADLQQFTYIVSHNLRAPLANARGFADLLPRLDRNSEVFEKSLVHLQTSLHELDAVITDVNTILSIRDKTELGRPDLVPIATVSEQVRLTLLPALRDCGGSIQSNIPGNVQLVGNRAYFYSIFFNLLANAIRYRSDTRPLLIDVTATQNPEQGTIITITDNGLGFDVEKAGDDVFQLYKRFHSTLPGRGMGLFLVKSHVEAMGGRVEVSSRLDEGARFTMLFK